MNDKAVETDPHEADPHEANSREADPHETKEHTRQFFLKHKSRYRVNITGASHIGHRRSRNEDHYAIMKRTRNSELLDSNLPPGNIQFGQDEAYGMVVADGIGGARFGDIASQLALETTLEASELATSWLMKFRDFDAQQVEERAAAYIERIQEKFLDFGMDNPAAQEMGTTLTCAYVIAPHAIIVQIGDSRAYLFRDGELSQLTRDQTLAQLLIDQGVDAQQAKSFGHVLLNCLGVSRENIESEILHLELQANDRLLLCSDGLTDMVDDDAIARILESPNLDDALQQLIQSALDNGGKDNVTVIIGEMLDGDTAPAMVTE